MWPARAGYSARAMRVPFLPAAALVLLVSGSWAWDGAQILRHAANLPAAVRAKVARLVDLVEGQKGSSAEHQVAQVNQFFNEQVAWKTDAEIWGQPDYWASPLETLSRGAGDCEDLAMAKYFALLGMGVPEAHLRLVYVRALVSGRPQAHMVLAWYPGPGSEPWILDNLDPVLRRASERADLAPVFSFNAQGLWQGASVTGDGMRQTGNPLTRLTIWRDARARARAEGF